MGKVSTTPRVHFPREANTQTLGQTVFGDSQALWWQAAGPPAATSQGRHAARQWSCLIDLSGQSFLLPALVAAHAHLFAQPASATTLRTLTQARALFASDAGTPVCIPTLPKWHTETTETHKRSVSVNALCTSSFISLKTMRVYSVALDVEDVFQDVLFL